MDNYKSSRKNIVRKSIQKKYQMIKEDIVNWLRNSKVLDSIPENINYRNNRCLIQILQRILGLFFMEGLDKLSDSTTKIVSCRH